MKTNEILTKLSVNRNEFTQMRASNIADIFDCWKKNKGIITDIQINDEPTIEMFGRKTERVRVRYSDTFETRELYQGFKEILSKKYTIQTLRGTSKGTYSFLMPALLCPEFDKVLGLEVKEQKQNNCIEFENGFQETITKVLSICNTKRDIYSQFSEYQTNILLDFTNGLVKIVYTNGHILYVSKPFKTSFQETRQIQLECLELKKHKTISLEICYSEFHYKINGIAYKFEPQRNYPDYQNAIPLVNSKSIVFDSKEMLSHIKSSKPYANKTTLATKLHLNGSIELQTQDIDYNKNLNTSFSYLSKSGFDVFDIGVNLEYLGKSIKVLASNEVKMEMSEQNRAMVLKSENELCLCMPTYIGIC